MTAIAISACTAHEYHAASGAGPAVKAWIASPEAAATIDTADLERLTSCKKFSLDVVHMRDGGIAVIPLNEETSDSLRVIMELGGAFKERPLDTHKI